MKDHKTTLRVPLDLHKAARIKAIEMDTNLSEILREFLRLWVADEISLDARSENESKTKGASR